jgi:hypothetical protein
LEDSRTVARSGFRVRHAETFTFSRRINIAGERAAESSLRADLIQIFVLKVNDQISRNL